MKSRRKHRAGGGGNSPLAAIAVGAAVLVGGYLLLRPRRAEASEENPAPAPISGEADFPLIAKLSSYWPAGSVEEAKLEGGPVGTRDNKLYSLQEYLAGTAPFVSVAADMSEFTFGEKLRIKELEEHYDRGEIDFRVVDALHADLSRRGEGTGTRRLDIRVNTRKEGVADHLNSWVHYRRLNPPAGSVVGEVAHA